MKQKQILITSGYEITLQIISDECNHLYICDSNLYPDSDSRSEELWRTQGLLIPINNKKELKNR